MANQEHLDILKQGVETWNQWRKEHPEIQPDLGEAILNEVDLSEADLSEANLKGASLRGVNLRRADVSGANLSRAVLKEAYLGGSTFLVADLSEADLTEADLSYASFSEADLSEANLKRAKLNDTNLSGTILFKADLSGADLSGARLVRTNLIQATLTDCRIYGISVWDVQLQEASQNNLIITTPNQPTITVDNLEVAQFIYLLLNNKKIREVIDTITSKVVLILGRFTPERKAVLDAIRDGLRKQNYLPVLFDFEKPSNRDLTETVSTLAHLARLIIVDLTDQSSAPHEVATIIPHCVVPIQPLLTLQPHIIEGKAVERREYAMFQDLRRRHPWVLPTFRYQDTADLLGSLKEHIIDPAEQKANELAQQ